jgi:4-methyl-5(b-hydroxyethyl)-thiazole monophosphate biosynthesis
VVVDGNILTSRGAGTAMDFGLLLIEKLMSAEKALEIARSICL